MNGLAGITDNAAFDVAIIGAGINGAGLFRELTLQGLRVLLVDRGTSVPVHHARHPA